jgi:hypothetical protein
MMGKHRKTLQETRPVTRTQRSMRLARAIITSHQGTVDGRDHDTLVCPAGDRCKLPWDAVHPRTLACWPHTRSQLLDMQLELAAGH